MLLVLLLAGLLWGLGWLMKTPVQARLIMIGLLVIGVQMLQVTLPDGHPLREATGSSPVTWVAVTVAIGLILIYRAGLNRLRARAQKSEAARAPAPPPPDALASSELNRYARHIVLREVGGTGQKALKKASVLVVGAGGLGSPVLQYLAAAGVGTIGLIDDDLVSSANLHRQVIHKDAMIDEPKVFSAQTELEAQNPFVTVKPYKRRLDLATARTLFKEYDLIVDGSDNFETRHLVNRAAVETDTPLVSGALTQWEGQVSVFDPGFGAPCYACVFPDIPDPALAPPCAEAGVIGPLPGVIGTMMALEAVKILTGAGTPLRGALLIYNGLESEVRRISVAKRPDCPICGDQRRAV